MILASNRLMVLLAVFRGTLSHEFTLKRGNLESDLRYLVLKNLLVLKDGVYELTDDGLTRVGFALGKLVSLPKW